MLVVPVAVVLMTALLPSAARASVPRETKRRAETNLLHAPRALGRLQAGLINRKTGWFRDNTTAVCRGTGRRVDTSWPRFICVVSHRTVRLRVLYIPQLKGFEIRKLRL